MRFSLLLLLVFSNIFCTKKEILPPIENPIPNPPPAIKYLALGDSYTIGQSVDIDERYPIQLQNRLVADSTIIDTTIIIAKTGWTTSNLKNAIANANLTDTFDLVSLLIGVNNQFQNKPIDEYEIEFEELLNTAIEFAGNSKENVFVLSIPDYAFTPFGNGNPTISTEIDDFNFVNKKITDSLGISYFDITPISRQGLAEPDLVATDGLHPSGEQYSRWIDLLYDAIKMKVNP